MKNLFLYADKFAKQSTWKDFAMVKFCLCAIGVIIGVLLPDSARTCAIIFAGVIFVVTYVPLMIKFIKIIIKERHHD